MPRLLAVPAIVAGIEFAVLFTWIVAFDVVGAKGSTVIVTVAGAELPPGPMAM